MPNKLDKSLNQINEFLKDKNLFYFVRDPERALGLEALLRNYHIIHIISTQYNQYFEQQNIKYLYLETNNNLINQFSGGARILFKNENVSAYLSKHEKNINFAQTFKVSPAFLRSVLSRRYNTINSSVEITRMFEEKLTQFDELAKFVKFPKTIKIKLSDVTYLQIIQVLGTKFVIQFARGHTGLGTHIVNSEEQFNEIKERNLHRTVKITSFIEGQAYTINACTTKAGVFMGGLSLQITGYSRLGALEGATIGNDWSTRINIENYQDIIQQTEVVGKLLYKKGFKGMFGVDFVIKESGEVFVIEVNARQTASVPMYTKIQLLKSEIPLSMLHLLEYFNLDIPVTPSKYNNENILPECYSQIFIRAENDFVVHHLVNMGIYRLQGDNAAINRYTDEVEPTTIFLDEDCDKSLLFQKYASGIDSMEEQGILIITPTVGRIIKSGEEVARIQLKQGAVDDQGKLSPWIIEALNAIKYHQS